MRRQSEQAGRRASGVHAGCCAHRPIAGHALLQRGGHAAHRGPHVVGASSADAGTESAEALRCTIMPRHAPQAYASPSTFGSHCIITASVHTLTSLTACLKGDAANEGGTAVDQICAGARRAGDCCHRQSAVWWHFSSRGTTIPFRRHNAQKATICELFSSCTVN